MTWVLAATCNPKHRLMCFMSIILMIFRRTLFISQFVWQWNANDAACASAFPCYSFSIFHIFQLFRGDGEWERKWCKKIKTELNGGSKYKTWKFQARLAVGFALNFIYFRWQNWDAILLVYLVWDNLQFYTTSCPPICSFLVTTKIECLKWPKYGISTLPRLFVYK